MSDQITTAAELDALPVESVVRCDDLEGIGLNVCERHEEGWQYVGSSLHFSSIQVASDGVVFTVLYRPDAPERTEPTEEQVRTLRGQLFDAGYREAELLAENKALLEEIREAKAEAWDEGLSAAYGHVYRQEDADAAGQGVLIPSPANPYRSEADHA